MCMWFWKETRFFVFKSLRHMCIYPCRAEPTRASALSRSESWYCCSGPRLFPHGPFSTTRSRDESCSLLSGRGRAGFTIRAKWDAAGDSCLLRNKLRKAITSRVGPEWLKNTSYERKSTTQPPHALWTLTWSTTTRKWVLWSRMTQWKVEQRHHATVNV